jgi:hypothetical protein
LTDAEADLLARYAGISPEERRAYAEGVFGDSLSQYHQDFFPIMFGIRSFEDGYNLVGRLEKLEANAITIDIGQAKYCLKYKNLDNIYTRDTETCKSDDADCGVYEQAELASFNKGDLVGISVIKQGFLPEQEVDNSVVGLIKYKTGI